MVSPDDCQRWLGDLVHRPVAVIVATGGAHMAAKAATTTIPIVCSIAGDPVEDGYVVSLNRPGGNLTGASVFSIRVGRKAPGSSISNSLPKNVLIGVLIDPTFSGASTQLREVQAAAHALGQQNSYHRTPPPKAKSKPPLRPSLLREPVRSASPATPSSTASGRR